MSSTLATSSLTGTPATTSTAPQSQLKGTQDEFLKMFMAQLQNQDPLNPQQGADMVAQLATFSQVEQTTQTNSELSTLTAQETSTASAGMANLVGRDADATAGSFTISGAGTPPALDLSCTGSLKGASITISDSTGKAIRTIPIPDGAPGTVQWDGKTDSGSAAPAGDYTLTVNTGSSSAAVSAQWHGTIGAVELTDSGARLRMGDILIAPSDVRTIGTTPTASSTLATSTALQNAALAAAAI